MNNLYIFDDYYPLLDVINNYDKSDFIIIPGLINDRNIEYKILPRHKFSYLIKIQNDYLQNYTNCISKEEMMNKYKNFKYGLNKLINKNNIVLEFGIVDISSNIMVLNINNTYYNINYNFKLEEMFKLI